MDPDTLSLLLWLVPLLLLAGAVAGLLAGLLGVGGGIVIVPALYHIFGYLGIDDSVRMHLAVGTSWVRRLIINLFCNWLCLFTTR